jgi:hypothetical protein
VAKDSGLPNNHLPGMRCHRQNPSLKTNCQEQPFRVSDDLVNLPVSAAELDVIEAFLSRQLRSLLAKSDPEPPQSHAAMEITADSRGRRS